MTLNFLAFDQVFFCSGARNQELLKEFNNHKLSFEYDERMASFKALGLTKVQARPVVVCTTSGTAVAECIPAMLEAKYSGLPLVLITGDRPKKLHGTGSPQTIDHESLTRGCRGTYLEISFEEFKSFELKDPEYPVHINVLVDDTVAHDLSVQYCDDLAGLAHFLKDKKAPLFLFSHEEKSMRPLVEKFIKTGHVFYAETLSGARELSTVSDERQLLELYKNNAFDCLVRVGHTPLSKIWRLLEKRPMPVMNIDSRNLPGLSFGHVIRLGSADLLVSDTWWSIIEMASKMAFKKESYNTLAALIDKYPHSEVAWMKRLHDALSAHNLVYLGNSLIIRFFELVQEKNFEVFGNRGVNGIDGQLATAIGMAMGTERTVYCVLGDYTTLYDLSSLREMPANLKLIIMNNQGGRIFDMLKLDKRIVMEHETEFGQLCKGMGRSYSKNLADLEKVQVTELNPVQSETAEFLKEWNQ